MHSTTPAVDFSKATLVVEEEETYDAGAFDIVEAEVVKVTEGAPIIRGAIPRIVNIAQAPSTP